MTLPIFPSLRDSFVFVEIDIICIISPYLNVQSLIFEDALSFQKQVCVILLKVFLGPPSKFKKNGVLLQLKFGALASASLIPGKLMFNPTLLQIFSRFYHLNIYSERCNEESLSRRCGLLLYRMSHVATVWESTILSTSIYHECIYHVIMAEIYLWKNMYTCILIYIV